MSFLQIKDKRGVWVFAATISAVAVCFAVLLVFLFYPLEIALYVNRMIPLIAVAITFPICMIVGREMLENHGLSLELQRLVDRDRLTNVATRDFFFASMDRDPDCYGISLMVDIDHFKRINDGHGHLTGDLAIRQVAHRLVACVRSDDIVCRFGGEEFVIFLHDVSPQAGRNTAERIRADIEAMPVLSPDGPVPMTVSIGGSLKDRTRSITESIRLADAALYRAKAAGRNRVEMEPIAAAVRAVPLGVGMHR